MPDDLNDQCLELQARLAALALGEADVDPEVQSHLRSCADCQRSLRDYGRIAQLLPFGAPDAAPPRELRARIIAAASGAQPAQKPVMRRRSWSGGFWRAAAVAAVLVALLGWNITLQRQLSDRTAQVLASRESWRSMIVLLNDPDVRLYPIVGDQGNGHLWATPEGTVACLVVENLPDLASDQVYQVWLVRGAEPTSGGVFESRGGAGWVLVQADKPFAQYESAGVTIEPRGGSMAPTGRWVLRAALAQPHVGHLSDRERLWYLLAQVRQPGS